MGELKQVDYAAAAADMNELLNKHGFAMLNDVIGFLEIFKLDVYVRATQQRPVVEDAVIVDEAEVR